MSTDPLPPGIDPVRTDQFDHFPFPHTKGVWIDKNGAPHLDVPTIHSELGFSNDEESIRETLDLLKDILKAQGLKPVVRMTKPPGGQP